MKPPGWRRQTGVPVMGGGMVVLLSWEGVVVVMVMRGGRGRVRVREGEGRVRRRRRGVRSEMVRGRYIVFFFGLEEGRGEMNGTELRDWRK